MPENTDSTQRTCEEPSIERRVLSTSTVYRLVGVGLVLALVAVQPAVAEATGEAFCDTDMAETIRNIFTIIQFGGPLIGGVLFLGAVAAMPMVRNADAKRDLKEIRNQGLVWGVIVAPLGTAIVGFILDHIVVGGVSCGF